MPQSTQSSALPSATVGGRYPFRLASCPRSRTSCGQYSQQYPHSLQRSGSIRTIPPGTRTDDSSIGSRGRCRARSTYRSSPSNRPARVAGHRAASCDSFTLITHLKSALYVEGNLPINRWGFISLRDPAEIAERREGLQYKSPSRREPTPYRGSNSGASAVPQRGVRSTSLSRCRVRRRPRPRSPLSGDRSSRVRGPSSAPVVVDR